ncbi:hypothetical protein H0H81_011423 [Sphagnurus paluster]|uniref:Uncharacterized protein n=1 Tax=Sphagnurus paluster TaxID=117069 RepID=A0A9P7KNM0_9AGAR|nr:hypothetical protein H0H81_011423 [Sphagnurus paluster]
MPYLLHPVILGVAAVVLLSLGNYQLAITVKMVDVYVAIICTLFATIWAATTSHHETNSFSPPPRTGPGMVQVEVEAGGGWTSTMEHAAETSLAQDNDKDIPDHVRGAIPMHA